jgi:hypothetical protein
MKPRLRGSVVPPHSRLWRDFQPALSPMGRGKAETGESEDSPLQTFLRGWELRVRIAPKALQQTLGNKKAIPRFPHST